MLAGKVGERAHRVVADREQCDAPLLKLGSDTLQLDQLRLAVRSPARAAIEDDGRPTTMARGVQVNDAAALIWKADVGERLADLGTDLGVVDRLGWCQG